MKQQKTAGLERSRKISVAALWLPVSTDGKKVLLTQRHAPGNPAWHLKWQIAGGGVDFGEEMEAAVLREMHEELHVKAKISSLPNRQNQYLVRQRVRRENGHPRHPHHLSSDNRRSNPRPLPRPRLGNLCLRLVHPSPSRET